MNIPCLMSWVQTFDIISFHIGRHFEHFSDCKITWAEFQALKQQECSISIDGAWTFVKTKLECLIIPNSILKHFFEV
jgi:hypothetical protein